MRIGEDHIRQEIEKTLDELEIRGTSKEKLMEYLDPEKSGDESLLEGLEQVDFGKQADQRRSQMASRAGQLPLSVQVAGWVSGGQAAVPLMTRFKRSRPQMCGRLIRALYAAGGPSMIFALQETIGDDGKGGEDSISALLGPEAEAALLAEAYFRQGKNTCLRNLIQIGGEKSRPSAGGPKPVEGTADGRPGCPRRRVSVCGRGEKAGIFPEASGRGGPGERADEGNF